VVAPGELDARVSELCNSLASNAPITMRASKEAIRRALKALDAADEDLLRETYASADFQLGVRAFLDKRKPQWSGR
jgi:enoyl-CoA hydratase/carnithine racemase